MTLTPHRDAAVATVEEVRRRHAAKCRTSPIGEIAERTAIDVCAAVLIGTSEMADLEVGAGAQGLVAIRALASAYASFLLTITGGDEALAQTGVQGGAEHFVRIARERIEAARREGVYHPIAQHTGQRGHA